MIYHATMQIHNKFIAEIFSENVVHGWM